MQELLIATRNPGKLREFEAIFAGLGIRLHTLDELGIPDEVEETGGFREIPDGVYPFEIAEARRQHGSNNNPDTEFFVITYNLEEEGEKQDWIVVGNLDEDGNIASVADGAGTLAHYYARCEEAGLPRPNVVVR